MTLETEFAEVLSVIAESLGIAAERIFNIVVGAQAAMGIINIGLMILTVLCCVIAYLYSRKWCGSLCADGGSTWAADDVEILRVIIPVVVSIVTLISVGVALWIISWDILRIVCPEYTAMTEIVKWIK